ncbi:hypothetical protein Tco_1431561, partial [Tanacetum coccineum]
MGGRSTQISDRLVTEKVSLNAMGGRRIQISDGLATSRDHYCCYARCVRFLERKNISRKGVKRSRSLFVLLLHREEYMSTADMVKIGGFWGMLCDYILILLMYLVNAAMFTLVLLRIAVNTASTARFKSRYYCWFMVLVLLAISNWLILLGLNGINTASVVRYRMTHTWFGSRIEQDASFKGKLT